MRCVICDYETSGMSLFHEGLSDDHSRNFRYDPEVSGMVCSYCDEVASDALSEFEEEEDDLILSDG